MAKILISVVEDFNDVINYDMDDDFPDVVESHKVLNTFQKTWPDLLEDFMDTLQDAQFVVGDDYRKAISDAIKEHQVKVLQGLLANGREPCDTK